MKHLLLLIGFGIANWNFVWGADVLPPGDNEPVLRLETGGPRSYVSGLAFSADGKQLYSAGWDKAVQVWNLNEKGQYEFSSASAFRIPTGGGLYGGLSALAISTDGEWIAAAGMGFMRGMSGERTSGWVVPVGVASEQQKFDEGLIYVFNTSTRQARLLKGHQGPVSAVTFVRGSRARAPELVSIGEDRVDDNHQKLRPSVRFWNVEQSSELAILPAAAPPRLANAEAREEFPSLNGFRPGLAAWSTGPGNNQARVALAWSDNQFRIWDVQSGILKKSNSSPNILAVVPLSSAGDKHFTGAHAQAGVWSVASTPAGELAPFSPGSFLPAQIDSVNGRERNLPTAAILLPGTNGTSPRIAIVVTEYPPPGGKAKYRLIIAAAAVPYKTLREINLNWGGEIRQPAIAATADGKRLAIAGNQGNEIELYSAEDLVSQPNPSPQKLGSIGMLLRDGAFVRSEDRWGLLLSDSKRDAEGRFGASKVLDISERRIVDATDKWKISLPETTGWKLESAKPGTYAIVRPGQAAVNFNLEDNHGVTSYAFCPISEHCPVPLLAVASQNRGQPLLQVFRADTGVPLRWCVGHTERIRSLQFSGDGRMLLSVADDRTASVWTVKDLEEKTINRHGQIRGLVVQARNGRLVVTQRTPVGLPLAMNDEIVSVKRAGEVVPIESPKEFYQFLLRQIPGSQIELAVRSNQALKTVTCTIDQAIDESKPLFTVFMAPPEEPRPNAEWEWIAWHPLGAFSTRSNLLDRWLGWQYNTGELPHPAKFAPIGEYRERYFEQDLLARLIEKQKWEPIIPLPKAPRISSAILRYRDGEEVPRDNYDELVYLAKSKDVEVAVTLKDVVPQNIRSLDVTVPGGNPIALKEAKDGEWTANLSALNWVRGVRRLTVQLSTADHIVNKEIDFDYRPMPSIVWETPPWNDTEIAGNMVTVNATVQPASDDEPVEFELVLKAPGQQSKDIIRWNVAKATLQINQAVIIPPGESSLLLVVKNAGPNVREPRLEMASKEFHVRRALTLMAPIVGVKWVESIDAMGKPAVIVPTKKGYISDEPRIRIHGTIKAGAAISLAQIQIDDGQPQNLANFKPDAKGDFVIDEDLILKPGLHELVILASVGVAEGNKRFKIRYDVPSPPQIKSLTYTAFELPKKENPKVKEIENPKVLVRGLHRETVEVKVVLDRDLDKGTVATLRLNGQATSIRFKEQNRDGQHILTAPLPLAGGKNNVTVLLEDESSRKNDEPVSQSFEVALRRPPVIGAVNAPAAIKDKKLDFDCVVESPIELRPVRVLIDGVEGRCHDIQPEKRANDTWAVAAKGISLPAGMHEIKIIATNAEGDCLYPAVHDVVCSLTIPDLPPDLTIRSPNLTGTVLNSTKLQIDYTVNSKKPATLSITTNGTNGSEIDKRTDIAVSKTDGTTVGSETIDLFPGPNRIELVAYSAGLPSKPQVITVSVPPPPVKVKVLRIGDLTPLFNKNAGAADTFDKPAPNSNQVIEGEIRVTNADDLVGGKLGLRIWVNGFKLTNTRINKDPKRDKIGTFKADLVLSQAKDNKIKVEVFKTTGDIVPAESESTRELVIDCLLPNRKQELFVLLLGNGNRQEMVTRAKTSLLEKGLQATQQSGKFGGERGDISVWSSAAFTRINVHDALDDGNFRVQQKVNTLATLMQKAQKDGKQPIVMIYYQGEITLIDKDFVLGVPEVKDMDDSITGSLLEEKLVQICGAHLVFLDLKNTKTVTAADVWPKAPNLGIAIANWTGDKPQPGDATLAAIFEKHLPNIRLVSQLSDGIKKDLDKQKFSGQLETVNQLDNVSGLQID